MTPDAVVSAAVHGTIGIAVVALLARCAQLPPAWQCWLWRLALAKAALSALWVLPLPLLPAPMPVPDSEQAAQTQLFSPAEPSGSALVAPGAAPANAEPKRAGAGAWVPAAYAVGAAVFLLRAGLGMRAGRRRMRGAQPCRDARAVEVWRRLGRTEPLRTVEGGGSPWVALDPWPCAVLPSGFLERAMDTELELALAHEAAHLRRMDLPWSVATTFVQVFLWFLPPVHWAASQMRQAAESACDLDALRAAGCAPSALASMLVALPSEPRPLPLAAAPMAAPDRRALEQRIRAMYRSPRTPTAYAVALVVLAVPAALVPWEAVAQAGSLEVPAGTWLQRTAQTMMVVPGVEREIGFTQAQRAELERQSKIGNAEFRRFGDELEALKRRGATIRQMIAFDSARRPEAFRQWDSRVWSVFTRDQQERLVQIALQYYGGAALVHPEVYGKLGLSPEQERRLTSRIRASRTQSNDLAGLGRIQVRPPTAAERRRLAEIERAILDADPARRTRLRAEQNRILDRFTRRPILSSKNVADFDRQSREASDRAFRLRDAEQRRLGRDLEAILTPAQRRAFREMQGERFTFPPGDLMRWFREDLERRRSSGAAGT